MPLGRRVIGDFSSGGHCGSWLVGNWQFGDAAEGRAAARQRLARIQGPFRPDKLGGRPDAAAVLSRGLWRDGARGRRTSQLVVLHSAAAIRAIVAAGRLVGWRNGVDTYPGIVSRAPACPRRRYR